MTDLCHCCFVQCKKNKGSVEKGLCCCEIAQYYVKRATDWLLLPSPVLRCSFVSRDNSLTSFADKTLSDTRWTVWKIHCHQDKIKSVSLVPQSWYFFYISTKCSEYLFCFSIPLTSHIPCCTYFVCLLLFSVVCCPFLFFSALLFNFLSFFLKNVHLPPFLFLLEFFSSPPVSHDPAVWPNSQ